MLSKREMHIPEIRDTLSVGVSPFFLDTRNTLRGCASMASPKKQKAIGDNHDNDGDDHGDDGDDDNGNDDDDDDSSSTDDDDYSSEPKEVSLKEKMNLPTSSEEELFI
jgi:hypothetical protein